MKNSYLLSLILLFAPVMLLAQPIPLAQRLHDTHSTYKETTLTQRRFKHADVQALIRKHQANPLFEISEVGKSFEGREISLVKVGNGPHTALLWTQMHGDEPTATMAMFDILNFLEARDDEFGSLRQQLLDSMTLYMVPMLNPDGAERYQRRTAQGIDLNRDALDLQTPEGRLLKELQQTLQPEYGFNLHDQSPRYSAGRTPQMATLSFLATAYDYDRTINPVRERSMKMIVRMNRLLQLFIPGQVGRYSDEHEARAFGDNIQKWGTTLVLIESGGYAGDPEKQYIRQLNFVAILSGLAAIADGSLAREDRDDYYQIPENGRYLFDLLVRNVTVRQGTTSYQTDLGINRNEINYANATKFFNYSKVEEYGDLSTYFGTEEINAEGWVLERGKVYPTPLKSIGDAAKLDPGTLWKQGYTYLTLASSGQRSAGIYFTVHPFHLLRTNKAPTAPPHLGDTATFLLKKEGKVRYVVINGFVYDVEKPFVRKGNGIIE